MNKETIIQNKVIDKIIIIIKLIKARLKKAQKIAIL